MNQIDPAMLAEGCVLVVAEAVNTMVAQVRAADAAAVLVVIDRTSAPLDLAQMTASIAPLAAERAPSRLNALLVSEDADPDDVAATARWLSGAASTTGQLLTVSRR